MKKIAFFLVILLVLVGCKKNVYDQGEGYYVQSSFTQNLQSLPMCDGCLQSTGSPKMLVIAIDFPNHRASTYGYQVEEIATAFKGTSAETGWESVHSYYQKSSYGMLNLDIDVLGWYRAQNVTSYYEYFGPVSGSSALVNEALHYYEQIMDLSIYDSNHDSFIDSLYIIYSRNIANPNSLWWGYQSYYLNNDYFDGVTPYYYAFSSRQFITINDEIPLDAHVYIHEVGHLLGLKDYYDYDLLSGTPYGLGGADMMDDAIGDHNPFSKMLLGWIFPTVVNPKNEISLTLAPFQENGEFFLIANNFLGNMFSEYFLIQYYTPTNLQAHDQMFSTSGILVYHVAANLTGKGDEQTFLYNNSYTSHKLISIIEADYGSSSPIVNNQDLFTVGSNFNFDTQIRLHNSKLLKYGFHVESMNEQEAVLRFFTQE